MPTDHVTREGWLHALAERLAPAITKHGHDLPPLRIGVGKGLRSMLGPDGRGV